MTDGVTKRYELTATRAVLYDVISSNIIDPLTGSEARANLTDWIFSGFPKPGEIGTPAPNGWKFPIVIIPFSEMDDENIVVSGTKDKIIHSVAIEVHSRSRLEANELAEQIRYILKITGNSELIKAALFGPDVISMTEDSDFIGGNKFYTKTIDYEFERMN